MVELTKPAEIVGLYSTTTVDWIEATVVTEAMVDYAIINRLNSNNPRLDKRRARMLASPAHRATTRRNIAIGIRCGSYWPYFA